MSRVAVRLFPALITLLAMMWSSSALAQSTIKSPGQYPRYFFEAEPHLLAGLMDPPGYGGDIGWGIGARGSFNVLPDGFLPKLNDSVAIGVGLDYLRYDGWQGPRGACQRFVSAPSGVPVCVEAPRSSYGNVDYFFLPAVMQWNFWLHRKWSVFGEPGVAMYFEDGDVEFTPFVLYAGGRYHFNDTITLTMRVGYPTFSLGVSFLL